MVRRMPVYEVFIEGKPRRIELTRTEEGRFTAKIGDKTLSVELPAGKVDFDKDFSLKIGDKAYIVELPRVAWEKPFSVKVEEATFKAEVKIPMKKVSILGFEPARIRAMKRGGTVRQVVEGAVSAPMTGKILSVRAKQGDQVKAGQILCVLEAMKMENEITAPNAGTVREVHVSEGSSVSEGEILFVVT